MTKEYNLEQMSLYRLDGYDFTFLNMINFNFKFQYDFSITLQLANQENFIEVFSIDQESGRVTKIDEVESANTPTLVVFLP